MGSLGSFGVAVRDADPDRELDTFEFAGQEFTVAPHINIIALGRFARAAREGADTDNTDGIVALIETVGSMVVIEDETRFLDHASKNRASVDDLMAVVQAVMERESGNPTQQPSDSSAGSKTTSPSSKASSSSAESSTPAWAETPFGRRELAANPEAYADILPIDKAAKQAGRLAV